ncbi:hypothetical protein GOBAR_DD23157 [Gossypium barbadense]|nr:hypothetical protein GOBAR_DD23157 [Gossypium barbadense]
MASSASAVLVADDIEEALITRDNREEDSSSALIEKTSGETLTLMIVTSTSYGPRAMMNDFKGAAKILEKGGYTQFTPHYITWYCPQAFTLSRQCISQCINRGRYCAPDPEQGFSSGLDAKKIEKCLGDPDADMENPVLEEEQDAQAGKGSRGDVTILPRLVVNNRQYRGKLAKGAVLKAICAGFEETTEPAVCSSGVMAVTFFTDVETNECLENDGGCWQEKAANLTACRIHFEEEFVNVSWLIASKSKEMDTVTVKSLASSCYSTCPDWTWVYFLRNDLRRQRNFPWGMYSTLPAVRSTGGDIGGNPPREQLRILHCWVCCHDMFNAKQPREDACFKGSCRLRQYLHREMRHEELMIISNDTIIAVIQE